MQKFVAAYPTWIFIWGRPIRIVVSCDERSQKNEIVLRSPGVAVGFLSPAEAVRVLRSMTSVSATFFA